MRAAAWLLVVVSVLGAVPSLAYAQGGPRPTITVPQSLNLESDSRTPLAIRVGPPAALPRNSFLRIRGLPPVAALSDGHAIAPGSWAVPLSSLSGLLITLPQDAAGSFELAITLVAVDGSVLAEGSSTLVISAPKAPAGAMILRTTPQLTPEPRDTTTRGAVPQPSRPAATPEDRERAGRLFQKGEEHMAEGNISAARLMFERAADAGLAKAAMALAATFDVAELSRLSVRGIQPDPKLARRWYERALELGDREAEMRLRRLGSN